jgi:hypothetical protein
MAQDGQEPAWLTSLREQQQRQQPPAPQGQGLQGQGLQGQDLQGQDLQSWGPQMGQEDVVEGPAGPDGPADVMEDLREHMIQAEVLDIGDRSPLAQVFLNLEPWQRLILAVFLFLDVALCGCMALVMAGRVALPF